MQGNLSKLESSRKVESELGMGAMISIGLTHINMAGNCICLKSRADTIPSPYSYK